MQKRNLHEKLNRIDSGNAKVPDHYTCPYCKYVFTPRQSRTNCPNCARELILWDLLDHV